MARQVPLILHVWVAAQQMFGVRAEFWRYAEPVTIPAGSRLLSRNTIGIVLVTHFAAQTGRPLFRYTREPTDLDGDQWEV